MSPSRRRPRLYTLLVPLMLLALLLGSLPVAAHPARASVAAGVPGVTELFFSEYIEGSSNNKALEIFNGTGAAIDLDASGYNVQMFFNGNPSPGLTINLSGTVADDDVFVLAHSSADPAILAQADQTNGAGWFNGDDAVVLRKGATIVDAIGQIGFDPGTEWGTGLTSTADNTLRRKDAVTAGDTNGADPFDPAVEWDGFAQNTFDGLGSHLEGEGEPVVASCGGPLTTTEGMAASAQVSATDADGTVVDIAITGVTPSPAPGTIALSDLVPAGAPGGTAAATVTVDAATPAGSYSVLVTATNDDDTPQTGTCTLTVNVNAAPKAIYEIQGSGATSPFEGTVQTTSGVVTVILGGGFFMQDPVGDGDPATSDGIFVFTGSSTARTFAPGDEVTVTGTVTEFRSSSRPRDLPLTEFSFPTLVKTGTGASLPDPVLIEDRPDTQIFPAGIDAFEALEGMLVEIELPTVVGPTNSFGEFVVVASGDASHTTPDGNILVEPLGGGEVDYNPERIMIDDEARQPGGSSSGTRINDPQVQVVVGDTAGGNIVGALDYQFSNYRVQASHALDAVLPGSTPESPVGSLRSPEPFEGRIATFNVENLFDCVDAPDKDDSPTSCNSGDLADLETQLTKLAAAFEQELGAPELVIVEETENTEVLTGDPDGNVPGTTIPALLPRIDGNYDAVSFDASDERGIEVGFIYNADRVVLDHASLATELLPDTEGIFDGSGIYGAGREPLVGFFTLDDVDLVVIGNHFKSKGGPQFGVEPGGEAGDDPLYGEAQPPTRWTEELRHKQADYVRDLVDLLLAQNPGAKIAVGGDLNDFAFAEPGEGQDTVARVKESPTAPLTNVVDRVPQDQRYTFIFEGNSQVLDHLLLDAGLEALLRDQGIAHFNADFPVVFGDDPAVTLRASDHDPLVAYFCTDATAPSLSVSVSPDMLWPPNHKYVTVQATVDVSDDADPGVALELLSVTSNEPDTGTGEEDLPNDIVIVDDDTFRLRAERADTGDGRVYAITYQATDACGNSTQATATVTVPHDLGTSR